MSGHAVASNSSANDPFSDEVEVPHLITVELEPTFPANSAPVRGVVYPVSANSDQPPGGLNCVWEELVPTSPNTALVVKSAEENVMVGLEDAALLEETAHCLTAANPYRDIPVMRATLIMAPVAASPVQSNTTHVEPEVEVQKPSCTKA